MINRFLRGCIRLYQLTLSPMLSALDVIGGGCRFQPTCSRYCLEALAGHGTARGLWLGIKRLVRCAPWGGMGYDPVPPTVGRRAAFTVPPAPPLPAGLHRARRSQKNTRGARLGLARRRGERVKKGAVAGATLPPSPTRTFLGPDESAPTNQIGR